MSTSEDINALLGLSPADILETTNEPKHEIRVIESDNLETTILNETNDVMESAKNALSAILDEVQATPNDAELVESASKFIQAHAGLLDTLSKLHLNKEKFKQQVALTQMKIQAADKINTDNNNTKVLLSREEVISRLIKDSSKSVIDCID